MVIIIIIIIIIITIIWNNSKFGVTIIKTIIMIIIVITQLQPHLTVVWWCNSQLIAGGSTCDKLYAITSDSPVIKNENEDILRNENHTISVVNTGVFKFIVFTKT